MKRINYNKIGLLLIAVVMSTTVFAAEFSKTYSETYKASEIKKLMLETKFGQVSIMENEGNEAHILVEVTSKESSEARAKRKVENVEIEIAFRNGTLWLETDFSSNSFSKGELQITYTLQVPASAQLYLESKYCNVDIESLTTFGAIELSYGNLNADDVRTEKAFVLEAAYSTVNIGVVNDIVYEAKYSTVTIGDAKNVTSDSKNCTITLGDVESIQAESKYDTYTIGSANSIIMPTAYTTLKVGEINDKLILESSYGKIVVGEFGSSFSEIRIENKYAKIYLGIPSSASYHINVYGSYCSFDLPDIDETTLIKENHTLHIKGTVGAETPIGSLIFESNYGGLTIKEN